MKILIHATYLMVASLIMISCKDKSQMSKWELLSPDSQIKMTVFKDTVSENNQKLLYQVDAIRNGEEIALVNPSPLGIETSVHQFTTDLNLTEATPITNINETYSVITGKQSEINNIANELALTFSNPAGQPIQLVLRAYNDGVAFRYNFPGDSSQSYTIIDEATGFSIPGNGKAWIQPYDTVTKYTPAYEKFYMNAIDIGMTSPRPEGWCFPALFNTNNHWILLTEAGMSKSFYGAHLNPEAPNGTYTIRMPEAEEGMGQGPQEASAKLPWSTIWRVLIIGDNLGTVVESNLVRNLNEPNQLGTPDWIDPGIASWSWWSDHDSPQNYESLRSFVDLAADMGWKYFLVDANWDLMQGGDVKQLIDYAKTKDVGILMWYNSGGAHNTVTERPRSRMLDPETRMAEMQKLQEWGVRGIKVDFFQSDKPFMMELYKAIIRDAADHEIMVNFHGCTIPRGWSRTYPNLMTMESVFGAEAYSFNETYPENAPWHNTILPATRNVVGPMDYTPVTFSDQQYPHITTYGHEIALSVVFESGIQHFADRVSAYRNLPNEPKSFLMNVPVTWDETRYVMGTPGKEMVIARRKGNDWYVGGINGEDQEKQMTIPLDFLNGSYQSVLITDDNTPRSWQSEQNDDISGQTSVTLLPYGGFVMHLSPVNPS